MLDKTIACIGPLDADAMEKCRLRLDNLTKPLNSLHSFEHIALQLAGITGDPRPNKLQMKKSIVLMGSVTNLENSKYQPVIDIFAAHVGAGVSIIDISENLDATQCRIMQAIERGIACARRESESGTRIIGLGTTGENAALHLSNLKILLSEESIDRDNLTVVHKHLPLEVAGLIGVILGAAAQRIAVVLDGPDTITAAHIAVAIAPPAKNYLIGSHFGKGQFQRDALNKIGIPAYLHLDMTFSHGCGATLGMSLILAALHVLNDMKTFGEAQVAVAQDGPGALRQSKDVL